MQETFIIDNYSTGKTIVNSKYKEIPINFEKYDVTILVDELQKFKGISEIKLNRDFLESRHKRASSFDVSSYYVD